MSIIVQYIIQVIQIIYASYIACYIFHIYPCQILFYFILFYLLFIYFLFIYFFYAPLPKRMVESIFIKREASQALGILDPLYLNATWDWSS